jgi:glycosyltransferase 2 family protein
VLWSAVTSVERSVEPSAAVVQSGSPIATIVRVGVVLVLFGGLAVALGGGWERLREYQWQFEPWAVAASFAMLLLASVWAALSWFAVIKAFGVPLAARPSLRIYSTSNLGKYLPGKVWHAFARVYLAQQHGVPVALATTTVLTDIVLYIAAGLLTAVVALPTVARAFGAAGGPLATSAALAAVVAGLALLHPAALNAGFRLAGRVMPRRSFPPIEASYTTILKIFVLYVVLWGLNSIALFLSVLAVGSIELSNLPTVGAIFALSYLSGLIMPLAPAGLGVREGLMALLLAQLMPVPAAAAASVLVRGLQVAAEGVCAAAFSRV